ncbi:hypothetical protein BS614_26480 [Paenibacillus xylanexedens]|nr:hypothetical protein BS614_26480 [Paenibacillus xylanexedens]
MITQEITEELLAVIDMYQRNARQLIDQLILETDQPDRAEILEGAYHLLTNADVIHGEEELTGNWYFDVHGEHCMFKTLEVFIGSLRISRIRLRTCWIFSNFWRHSMC